MGNTVWTADELVGFVEDCAHHGTKAVSFGGGEPLEYPAVFDVLQRLRGKVFRSLTSNGLLLHGKMWRSLLDAQPDKVHLSIHFPDRTPEVDRVIRQVHGLAAADIRSGVNLLVRRSQLAAVTQTAQKLRESGIGNDRIVYLPMRGQDTPTPKEVAIAAGKQPFQATSCLAKCKASPRFCSISWDRQVGWCSYTTARHPLEELTAAGLNQALKNLPLIFCGGSEDP